MKQHFWRRWSNEWLCKIQVGPKWLKIKENPKIGDLVVVFDERSAPGEWSLAGIKGIHPGNDGCVRLFTLLSKGKNFKRPFSKIALVPTNIAFNDNDSKSQLHDDNDSSLV